MLTQQIAAVAIEVEERRTPIFLSQHLEGASVIVYRLNGTGFLLLPMEPGCNRYGAFWSCNSTAPFVGPQFVAQLSCMSPPEMAVVAAFPCVTEGNGLLTPIWPQGPFALLAKDSDKLHCFYPSLKCTGHLRQEVLWLIAEVSEQ